MKPFKFFQKKSERVFTEYMDRMDDYFLGGIREERLRRMDETYPEYYHTVGFEFVDVSPIVYSPETFVPQKYMMFRCRNTGVIIQGNLIGPDHPMYNFPDIV